MPVRIQRKRIKGWRMPEGAVYVGRPTEWGNRYYVGHEIAHVDNTTRRVHDSNHAAALYREWFEWQTEHGYPPALDDLRGKDLCCWCPLDQPCHADVLLELANQPSHESGG